MVSFSETIVWLSNLESRGVSDDPNHGTHLEDWSEEMPRWKEVMDPEKWKEGDVNVPSHDILRSDPRDDTEVIRLGQ